MSIDFKLAKFQTVKSKMEKTLFLIENCLVEPFIPETLMFSFKNLKYMLNKYQMVVFKPDGGTGGKKVGMIKEDKRTNKYCIQLKSKLYKNMSINEVHKFVEKISKNKTKFILQRGIDLIKYNDNVVDIRVFIQKPFDDWEVTGIVGKIAADNRIVTNSGYGGTGLPLDDLLRSVACSNAQISKLTIIMSAIAHHTADTLTEIYPGIRALGLDIGLDKNLHPWILEVNTKPRYKRFNMIEDKSMYNKIEHYYKIILDSLD